MTTETTFTKLPLVLARTHLSKAALEFKSDDSGGAMGHAYQTDPLSRKRTPEYIGNAQRLVDCWNACLFMTAGDLQFLAEHSLARHAEEQARQAAATTITP